MTLVQGQQDPGKHEPYEHVEESLENRIERLGRQRPEIFSCLFSEYSFVFSIAMSQFLVEYFVSGFTLILPTLIEELGIPQSSAVWPSTAFSVVNASTLLVFGRLGDMFGGYYVFLGGLVWLLVWSIVAGFSINPVMLIVCRALQGLGSAAFLPTGIMLLGTTYRPGPRKNLVFSIYGTSGIFGFFGGIVIAGISGQWLRWAYYFWIGAMLAAVTLATTVLSVPLALRRHSRNTEVQMDYLGSGTIVTGLILCIFAITQSAHTLQGWKTPYIPVCFVLGVLCLMGAAYIEARIATYPLIPVSIFSTPVMKPLCFALLLLYGTWGIFSVYGTLYFQLVLSASPIEVVTWYIPLGIGGLLFSVLEGLVLHLVPGKVLLVISGFGALGSQLLLALLPAEGWNYWSWIFPATLLSTIGIDISTILMTVFVTTSFPAAQQGLAGSVVNSVLQLGIALCLGLTDILQSATVASVGLAPSLKYTFWFGVAAGAVSLIVLAVWGSVPKATSELSVEEKEEITCIATQQRAESSGRPDRTAY